MIPDGKVKFDRKSKCGLFLEKQADKRETPSCQAAQGA